MSRIVPATDFHEGIDLSRKMHVDLLSLPDTCPICHYSIETQPRMANRNQSTVEVIFNCTRKECRALFIGYYNLSPISAVPYPKYSLRGCAPMVQKERAFEDEIRALSPNFVKIYNQSSTAKNSGLDQVAGMGFRKALEFLVKDYLISFKNEDKETIERKLLGKCIKDHIDNQNIKSVAERATWLGNDETHYIRKWEDKDVNDLIKLIDLTVFWMASDILTHKLISEMN